MFKKKTKNGKHSPMLAASACRFPKKSFQGITLLASYCHDGASLRKKENRKEGSPQA